MERAGEHGEVTREGKPALYVVATPIGNLKDITFRAIEVLKGADVVAAEDTRVTAKLLNHYGIIAKKLISLHQHNEEHVAAEVIAYLQARRSVALASDAGTPAFSDPGARLVRAVRAAGWAVIPIPGPNAAATALSASGLVDPKFIYYGFLPSKSGERRTAIQSLAMLPYHLVFYEAPHRVLQTIGDLRVELGGARSVVIAREMTKLFETIHTCSLGDAQEWLSADANRQKGEFVLIVEAATQNEDKAMTDGERALAILLEELPVKQAAALAARLTGARKNYLYAKALQLKGVAQTD
jgi:16S rRNA (cytidine1402-2'-O)-methyltransferase